MLYLATLNGETLPQALPILRESNPYPFQVECKNTNLDQILPGTVVFIVGYKLGKYQTNDGKLLAGTDSAWCLVG